MVVKNRDYTWHILPFSLPPNQFTWPNSNTSICEIVIHSLIKTKTSQQTKLTDELQPFPLEM